MPPRFETGLKLATGAQRILDIVHKGGMRGIETTRLFDLLYGDDPNGGPDTGVRTLHVRIWHLNQRLKEVGYKIMGQHTGSKDPGCYRLVRIAESVV